MNKPAKRGLLTTALAVLVVGALALGFRAPPVLVDTAEATRGVFRVTLEEEGRTRVADRYDVSTPVTGYLGRIALEPGDRVNPGDTLFVVSPLMATPLDARSRAQAETSVARAEAALQASRTLVEAEEARSVLAHQELDRIRSLVGDGHMPAEHLDRAQAEARRAAAALRSARFSVDVAGYERDTVRAMLLDPGSAAELTPVPVRSPVAGTVLRRLRQSEGAVQAGETMLSLGNLESLEIEVDVLSPDAVRLRPGMLVEIDRWGGEQRLLGRVRRIEPAGFTRVSALGVEEQRVWAIVDMEQPPAVWHALGDGYRVETRFILWQGDDVLQIPASALFRQGDTWGVYLMKDDRAHYQAVMPGRRSGLMAEITTGLHVEDRVILHPGQDIAEGVRVRGR